MNAQAMLADFLEIVTPKSCNKHLLNSLTASLQSLLTNGQCSVTALSQSLYTGRTDEFGQIEFALRMMQAETGAVIGRIGDASNRLSEHTRGLLKDIESSNVLTVEQQAETDQIATAVNQMAASIQEVASNAQHAADAAGRADTETASGQRLVAHTSQSITALEGEIRQAAQVIHELEGQSNEISKVLDVIRGIAEQTNLLALNAAIEAARAGCVFRFVRTAVPVSSGHLIFSS